jgi:hypothetical protein
MITRIFCSALAVALTAQAQEPPKLAQAKEEKVVPAAAQEARKLVPAPKFFENQEPLAVTFTTNISRLRHDKMDTPPWRTGTFSYLDAEGKTVEVPVKARTRGIWRLKMCDFPPLRLNFAGETTKGTIFHKLDKPKMVSYCRDMDSYEQYILQEFQLYRIYEILTPQSHRARLLKISYADSGSGKIHAKRYAFIIEEPSALAARLGGKVMEQKGAMPGDLDPYPDAVMGVFQYMIGNTDFSTAALHNVELFFDDNGTVSPIAYDFDFAGAINTQYAAPDQRLSIQNVKQRLYRGYCSDSATYDKVFSLFNEKKAAIYALYADSIGSLLPKNVAKQTLRYFDDFYETINDRSSAKRSILESCIGRR